MTLKENFLTRKKLQQHRKDCKEKAFFKNIYTKILYNYKKTKKTHFKTKEAFWRLKNDKLIIKS